VAAQYNPYSPNPYARPPNLAYVWGPGSALSGAAQVIQATGQFGIQQEQARIAGEQANQANIQTKRLAFDEGLYERANSPSYLGELDYWTQLRIQRVMNQPGEAEISHGDTLNLLLPYLKTLVEDGSPGPAMSLNPDTLRAINVRLGVMSPTAGMRKDAGHRIGRLPCHDCPAFRPSMTGRQMLSPADRCRPRPGNRQCRRGCNPRGR
jgi:hypothetical protein